MVAPVQEPCTEEDAEQTALAGDLDAMFQELERTDDDTFTESFGGHPTPLSFWEAAHWAW